MRAGVDTISMWLFLLTLGAVGTTDTPPGTKQFCQFDSFKAACENDEVILMANAKYGRMRSGRCISGEGYIGCSTDVTSYMDTQCSGRRTCEVTVTSLADVAQPCRRDYTSYLEASFKCIKVAMADPRRCHLDKYVEQTAPSGFLASITTEEQRIGTVSCPWQIHVQRGQQISLQLSVFGQASASSTGQDKPGRDRKCPWSVVVEEDSTFKNEDLCGNRRNTNIFTSETNIIQIYFNFMDQSNIPSFGIEYKVVGCPDIKAPTHALVKRTGEDLHIRCNRTRETWYLTCKHGEWIGGMGNCTADPEWGFQRVFGTAIPFPQGLIVAIILGIVLGVIIGSVSLGLLLIFRKRKQMRAARANTLEDPMLRTPESEKDACSSYKTGTGPVRSGNYTSKSQFSSSGYYSGDTLRSAYPPGVADYNTRSGHTGPGYARRSHVYETPRLPEEMTTTEGKVYFELDPSDEKHTSRHST